MDAINQIKMCAEILQKKTGGITGKLAILDFLLGLTGSEEGLKTLYEFANIIVAPLTAQTYNSHENVARNSIQVLLNMSAESDGVEILCSIRSSELPAALKPSVCHENSVDTIFPVIWDHILAEKSSVTEYAIMTFVNISRHENMARKIYESLENGEEVVKTIATLALETDHKYNYLPSLLANLTQLVEIRTILLLESNREILRQLLMLFDCKDVAYRRSGAVSMVRNLCLSEENHKVLFNPEINLVTRILFPLAGLEEYKEGESESLPLDLRYLPADKTREPEASIRKMLLEILMKLCTTKFGRELLREYNVYVILREYHLWETEPECVETCENVVYLLMRDEHDIGVDNLGDVDIPLDLMEKFSIGDKSK